MMPGFKRTTSARAIGQGGYVISSHNALLLSSHANHHFITLQASPKGQACFDRLLKACNDVVWKEQSILVLNQVQVDPPYAPETCKIVQRNTNKKSLEDGSLERVRKIVAAVENMNTVGASVASSASAPPADAKDSL